MADRALERNKQDVTRLLGVFYGGSLSTCVGYIGLALMILRSLDEMEPTVTGVLAAERQATSAAMARLILDTNWEIQLRGVAFKQELEKCQWIVLNMYDVHKIDCPEYLSKENFKGLRTLLIYFVSFPRGELVGEVEAASLAASGMLAPTRLIWQLVKVAKAKELRSSSLAVDVDAARALMLQSFGWKKVASAEDLEPTKDTQSTSPSGFVPAPDTSRPVIKRARMAVVAVPRARKRQKTETKQIKVMFVSKKPGRQPNDNAPLKPKNSPKSRVLQPPNPKLTPRPVSPPKPKAPLKHKGVINQPELPVPKSKAPSTPPKPKAPPKPKVVRNQSILPVPKSKAPAMPPETKKTARIQTASRAAIPTRIVTPKPPSTRSIVKSTHTSKTPHDDIFIPDTPPEISHPPKKRSSSKSTHTSKTPHDDILIPETPPEKFHPPETRSSSKKDTPAPDPHHPGKHNRKLNFEDHPRRRLATQLSVNTCRALTKDLTSIDFPGADNFQEVFHDWCAVDGYAPDSRVARMGRMFALFTESWKDVVAHGESTFQLAQSLRAR
jgi:hypothetical protein